MRFLRLLKFIALAVYSTLDVAELRTYEWDGVFPLADWHGWCDMYGAPYQVLFNAGEHSVAAGWLEVIALGSLQVIADVTGEAPGVVGSVALQFQGALALDNSLTWVKPSDMQFSAEVLDDSSVRTVQTIDISAWNYIRFVDINNMASGAVRLRLMCHDGVRPVDLP